MMEGDVFTRVCDFIHSRGRLVGGGRSKVERQVQGKDVGRVSYSAQLSVIPSKGRGHKSKEGAWVQGGNQIAMEPSPRLGLGTGLRWGRGRSRWLFYWKTNQSLSDDKVQ